jgi:hypothetical protein
MSNNIYLILFVFLVLCVIIIFTKTQKKALPPVPTEEPFVENIGELIDISMIKEKSVKSKLLITRLDVVGAGEDANFPNKHLLIEGTNLDKLEDVYFGDLKGIILQNENIEKNESIEKNEKGLKRIKVLPPNFSKYTKMKDAKEFENIEIKLKIDDPVDETPRVIKFKDLENDGTLVLEGDRVYNAADSGSEGDNSGLLKVANAMELPDESFRKVKISFKLGIERNNLTRLRKENLKLKLNDKEYLLNMDFIQEIPEDESVVTRNKVYTIFFDSKDVNNIKFNLHTNEIFEKNKTGADSNLAKIILKDMKMEYLHDDINVLYPTGLFYRFDYVTAGNNLIDIDASSWNIYLGEKLDNRDILLTDDVRKFYEDIKDITSQSQSPAVGLILYVSDVRVSKVKDDDTIMRMIWTIPKEVNNYRFAFLINVLPKAGNERFSIKNEQIAFNKNKFDFPTNKLVPGNEYTFQVQTYRSDKQEVVAESDIGTFKYIPPSFDDYHSHLFDPVTRKFKTELTQEQPELIKTYYQLLAANKIKMSGEMAAAGKHISEEAECSLGNLNQINDNTSNDAFDENLKDLLSKNADEEKTIFSSKQLQQEEQIERINQKVSELERIQGKVNNNRDTKIKRITSIKDGTNLAVKKMSNGKFMVGLNQGCLATNNMGNYNYVKCNMFDKKQYFDLESIKNTDEYNNLLLMNLQPQLSEEMNVDYPFYVLKPNKSNKCVHLDNKQIKIKPCNDEESIRYIGHFTNSECSKN